VITSLSHLLWTFAEQLSVTPAQGRRGGQCTIEYTVECQGALPVSGASFPILEGDDFSSNP